MNTFDIISLLLLITFCTAYIYKLVLLKRKEKINANVLGHGNKDLSIRRIEIAVRITSSMWLITWLSEILLHSEISLLKTIMLDDICYSFIGITITAIGVLLFIISTVFMKSSWRVGIDKSTKTKLVTNGIYKFSRNPAFVGFDLMFIGLFFTYANLLTLFVFVINTVSLHLLILQEEKHLLSMFGFEYEEYKKKVPRYFLFL